MGERKLFEGVERARGRLRERFAALCDAPRGPPRSPRICRHRLSRDVRTSSMPAARTILEAYVLPEAALLSEAVKTNRLPSLLTDGTRMTSIPLRNAISRPSVSSISSASVRRIWRRMGFMLARDRTLTYRDCSIATVRAGSSALSKVESPVKFSTSVISSQSRSWKGTPCDDRWKMNAATMIVATTKAASDARRSAEARRRGRAVVTSPVLSSSRAKSGSRAD